MQGSALIVVAWTRWRAPLVVMDAGPTLLDLFDPALEAVFVEPSLMLTTPCPFSRREDLEVFSCSLAARCGEHIRLPRLSQTSPSKPASSSNKESDNDTD